MLGAPVYEDRKKDAAKRMGITYKLKKPEGYDTF